jgi:NodT family efflux transporter outer membrane factor (OMF) lipoprotein
MTVLRKYFFCAVRIVGLGALLILTSCSNLGPHDLTSHAVTVPTAWQHGSPRVGKLDPAALTLWWERFNDPVLNELMAGALHSSPNVRTALSRIAEYRARRGVARAALFPSLNANASGRETRTKIDRTHENSKVPGTQLTTIVDNYGASLDASWQVDLFGRQQQTLKAASADLAQIQENYYGAQVSLAAEVALAYVTLRSAEAQLLVVQNSLGTRRETVQLTQWREQAGTGNALDTQQSISTLAQAEASIPALQLIIAQTKNQLALLSGRTPGALDALLATPRDVPSTTADLALGIPAEMLRQRPDVRAAERGLEAAFARTTSAQRERYPTITVTSSLMISAFKTGRLYSPASTVASLLASLAQPIFDAGRISQNIKIQTELQKQTLLTYESTVLTALSEVEDALVAIQRSVERLTILHQATTAAQVATHLLGLQYQAGQLDLFIYLEAQRTLLTLEQQEVITTADRTNAYIQLYQALGGGWSPL